MSWGGQVGASGLVRPANKPQGAWFWAEGGGQGLGEARLGCGGQWSQHGDGLEVAAEVQLLI